MVSTYTPSELKTLAEARPCRYCGAPVVFDGHIRNPNTGNRLALNIDLSIHRCRYVFNEEGAICAAIAFIKQLNLHLKTAELSLVRKERRPTT